jgi:hypothetical protein
MGADSDLPLERVAFPRILHSEAVFLSLGLGA